MCLRRRPRALWQFQNRAMGRVSFGSLRRVTPISRTQFGFDRGQPVDRYFVENFLER